MGNIISFNELNSITNISTSDKMHLIRSDENILSLLLSYKSNVNLLSSFYLLASNLNNSITTINNLINNTAKNLSNDYVLKSTIDSTYIKQIVVDNFKTKLLTRTQLDSILEKYPNAQEINKLAHDVKEYSYKLQEEMTDFAGAAMIGIGQSMPNSDELSG